MDDMVLTVAVADYVLNNQAFTGTLQEYGRKHPYAGYSNTFISWVFRPDPQPYDSWGNGSDMRVSPG